MLSSCVALPIPHERRLSPLYFGHVTDADTGKPIESVVISVGGSLPSKEPIPSEAKTDSSGYYEAEAKDRTLWFVVSMGTPVAACGGTILFLHPEYEMRLERTHNPGAGAGSDLCAGVEHRLDVSLKKRVSDREHR